MSSKQSIDHNLTDEQYSSYLDFMKVLEELSDNRPEFQEDMFLNMNEDLNN